MRTALGVVAVGANRSLLRLGGACGRDPKAMGRYDFRIAALEATAGTLARGGWRGSLARLARSGPADARAGSRYQPSDCSISSAASGDWRGVGQAYRP
jgi:hypothetical protein